MAEFTAEIAADVVTTCQAGADEAAEGLQRAFEQHYKIDPGEAGELDLEALSEEFDGPGLAIVLKVEDSAAVLLIAESSGLIPSWYAQPDATGESKLATLAQELGMVLLPEAQMPTEYLAGRVDRLSEALGRAELAEKPGWVPLTLTAGEHNGVLHLIWPAANADKVIVASTPEEEVASQSEEEAPSQADGGSQAEESSVPHGHRTPHRSFEEGLNFLPPYVRSLLHIQVPVTVTLATTKQPVSRILELGPGSIIQFDKSCDETLSLEVGDQEIAAGEAVKVGDKFGLRITSVTMPDERFWAVKGKREAKSA